jgi:hypothetical protein
MSNLQSTFGTNSHRSSLAEGLLTEAERARFGSKPRPLPITLTFPKASKRDEIG